MIADGRIVVSSPLAKLKAAHAGKSLDEIFVANLGRRAVAAE
jgi:hypothetical protein